MNKFLPGPESTTSFIPIPRKYSSPLHKKFAKLEKAFESAEGKPCRKTRISKSAQSVHEKLLKIKSN